MEDIIYYNFPIAIFQQVRPDIDGNIVISTVNDAINDAISYALFVAYKKRLHTRSDAIEYDGAIFDEIENEMGFCSNDPDQSLETWAATYAEYKHNSVFVGADKSLLFSFRDELDYKSDFEIDQLLAFLAIRSIIGAGHYNIRVKHIKWDFVLSRMAGYEKAVKNLNTLPAFISRYASRRLHDKLINALCEHWHMQYYGKNLGKGCAPLFTFSQDIDIVQYLEREKQLKRNGTPGNGNDLLQAAIYDIIKPA